MSQFSQFNDPSSSNLPQFDDLLGSLLLFTVYEMTDEIITVHGPQTAIRADVVVLDGKKQGEQYGDTLIFPRKLKAQLQSSVGGKMVLGRLAQGDKKPGLNAPWTLDSATDADRALAQKFVDANGHPAEVRAAAEEEFKKPF